MFTIKACHEAGPVWIGGVTEVHTIERFEGIDPLDWLAEDDAKRILGRTGEIGLRVNGSIGDSPWVLVRVLTPTEAYNLAVPEGLTFIMNDAGATIDRI